MRRKFAELDEKINNLISKLEEAGVEGPIPFLEEAQTVIASGLEEYEEYLDEMENEEDYEN